MSVVKTTVKWPPKDPDETLDYGFDWAPRTLGTDVITSTTATIIGAAQGLAVEESRVATSDEITAYNAAITVYNQTVPTIKKRTPTKTGQMSVIWLSGGTVGQTALIQLIATTGGGRILDQMISITIAERI
jgi:hypothetical protein